MTALHLNHDFIIFHRDQEGVFKWSRRENGKIERGKYSNWLRDEVDGRDIAPKDPDHLKNCVTWSWSLSPGWKTQNCSEKFYFLCQVSLNKSIKQAGTLKDCI